MADPLTPATATVKTIELHAKQVAARHHFPFELKVDYYLDDALNAMVLNLSTFVYGEQRQITVRTPADWREAVKERFAPKWVLTRWPVKYRDIKAELFAAYPDIGSSLPAKFGQPVVSYAICEPFKYDDYIRA